MRVRRAAYLDRKYRTANPTIKPKLITHIIIYHNIYTTVLLFLTFCKYNPERVLKMSRNEKWVRSSIRAVNVGKLSRNRTSDNIEALQQYRDPLVQVAGLSSLARYEWDPPSTIIKEVAGWCVEYAQGLYRDRFKDVTGITKVNILLLFAGSCHLCCCTCLRSGSAKVWLSHWACNSDIPS